MIIGIDIDNTLTDVQKEINIATYKYAKILGKDVSDIDNLDEGIDNNSSYYINKFHFNYDELKYFLSGIWENIVSNAEPRENVSCVIKNYEEKEIKYILSQLELKNFTKIHIC